MTLAGQSPLNRGLEDSRKALSSWRFVIFYAAGGAVVTLIAGLTAAQRTDDALLLSVIPAGVFIAWIIFVPASFVGRIIFRAASQVPRVAGPSDKVAKVIAKLSAESRSYLCTHAGLIADGVSNDHIPPKVSQELTKVGICDRGRMPWFDGWANSWQTRPEWTLSDFGKEVVAELC